MMSRKWLWLSLLASLGLFTGAAVGPFTSPAQAEGCFMTGSVGTVCGVVQHCDLNHCHYHTYVDTPACRPSGSGPDCGMY